MENRRENNIDNFYPSLIDENSETTEGFETKYDELDDAYDPDYSGDGYSGIYITKDPAEADYLLGIGRNKQKKAEKKVQKAQKQLAKGHVKAAERKLKKAGRIQSQIAAAQKTLGGAIQSQKDINATAQNLNTMSTQANESMNTAPGEIGLAGMPTQQSQQQVAQSSLGGGGGGGGDFATMDAGTGGGGAAGGGSSDEPTGALAEEKTLEGVTVKAKKANQNKILMYIGIGVAVLLVIFLVAKYAGKHKGMPHKK